MIRSESSDPPSEYEVEMEERWLSVDEGAECLSVSKCTKCSWVTSKRMPGHKVGHSWKFKRDVIDEWIRASGVATCPA